MLDESAESFLWSLFRLGLFESNPKRAVDWAGTLYEHGLDLPEKGEALLSDYCSSGDKGVLLSLARIALESFWLDVEHRTRLAAYLFVDAKIDLNQVCAFLSFDGVNVDDLTPVVRKVADVLWLLRQDIDAGVMEPGQDHLMSDALRELAEDA